MEGSTDGRDAQTSLAREVGDRPATARGLQLRPPRAQQDGTNHVAPIASYSQYALGTAGFRDIDEIDVTADCLISVRAWFDESSRGARGLRTVLGDALFEDRQSDPQLQISAIERGPRVARSSMGRMG